MTIVIVADVGIVVIELAEIGVKVNVITDPVAVPLHNARIVPVISQAIAASEGKNVTVPGPITTVENVTSITSAAYPTFVAVSSEMSEAAHGMLNSNRWRPRFPAYNLSPFSVFDIDDGGGELLINGVAFYSQNAISSPIGLEKTKFIREERLTSNGSTGVFGEGVREDEIEMETIEEEPRE